MYRVLIWLESEEFEMFSVMVLSVIIVMIYYGCYYFHIDHFYMKII